MTKHDENLIKMAGRLRDHQDVDSLIPRAESQEAKRRLRMMSDYRYHLEEHKSGIGV